jgi:hypothetical protein
MVLIYIGPVEVVVVHMVVVLDLEMAVSAVVAAVEIDLATIMVQAVVQLLLVVAPRFILLQVMVAPTRAVAEDPVAVVVKKVVWVEMVL